MTARILDGKATAREIREDLTRRVSELAKRGITPGLGTVLPSVRRHRAPG